MTKKTSTISQIITKKIKEKNIQKSILEVDDLVNHHLELLDINASKETVMKQAIQEINKAHIKNKIIKNKKGNMREYFDSLNNFFKGKLFYIALKDSKKYLKFTEIEAIVDKQTLLGFIKEIEVGQEYAWSLIDNIRSEKLKNFLYGIFTYLYF